jgi:hypothetical protein
MRQTIDELRSDACEHHDGDCSSTPWRTGTGPMRLHDREGRGHPVSAASRRKVWRHERVLTEHVFDKLWQLDMTLAEFRALLDEHAEVIEASAVGVGNSRNWCCT